MDLLKTIKVPSLLDSSYGDNLEEQFKNINSNFNTLANGSFVKGDDAPDIKTYIIDLNPVQVVTEDSAEEDGNTWENVFNIIKKNIYDSLLKKITEPKQSSQLKFSNLALYYKELEIPSIIDDDFIQQITLGFSTVYIYDAYYYGLNSYNENSQNFTGLYQITPDVESGKYVYNISIIENFPQLIFKDNIWQWKIDGNKLISAQGEKGDPGTNAVTYMVTVDNNEKIVSINGVKINEIETEDYSKYDNQACFVITSNVQDNIKIALIKKQNNILVLSNQVSITSTFTVNNFMECMTNESMPGLFIPTTRTNNTDTGTKFSGYILKNDGGNLQILYGELVKSESGWKFSNPSTQNIYIGNNILLNGEIKPEGRELILINGKAQVSGNFKVIGETYLNNLDASGNSKLNNLTVYKGSNLTNLDVSGDSNLKNLYISGEITTKDRPSIIINSNTDVNGKLNIQGDLNASGDIKINGKSWSAVDIAHFRAEGKNMTLPGSNGSRSNVYWDWNFRKKNGFVKLIVTPRVTKDGSAVPKTTDWQINDMTNNGTHVLENVVVGEINILSDQSLDQFKPSLDQFKPEYSGLLGKYTDLILGWEEKCDGLIYSLEYNNGGFTIKISRGRIYVENKVIMHKNFADFGYTPYMEFIYPSI